MNQRQKGFTLLEVMVALVILATTMVGIYNALTSETHISGLLRDKTYGLWIAQNVLKTYQMHALGQVSAGDEKSGTENQYQQTWTWHLSSSPSVLPEVVEVKIAVRRNEKEIISLIGFANVDENNNAAK